MNSGSSFGARVFVPSLDDVQIEENSPNDLEPVRLAMQRALDCVDFQSEFRVIHPDGSAHWIYGCGALLLGPDGKPVGMTGINMDMAEVYITIGGIR